MTTNTTTEPLYAERKPRSQRRLLAVLVIILLPLFCVLTLAGFGTHRHLALAQMQFAPASEEPSAADLDKLARQLTSLAPRGVFVTVDAVDNRLQVRSGDKVLRDAVCSAGTGSVLEDPKTGRRWTFDTPRGVRTVKQKKKDPVWTKPEWAFIEEGEDLPKKWSDRIDTATLGAYALYLGDGYMIHGTLYQRYLGRNVTHGCVRLGDADLEFVYQKVPVGATVFLF